MGDRPVAVNVEIVTFRHLLLSLKNEKVDIQVLKKENVGEY